jgi:hypothetical protein
MDELTPLHRQESATSLRSHQPEVPFQEAGSEDKGNFVSIYVSVLFALCGAVVIFATRFTKEERFGIQEGFVNLVILAGPQTLLFVVGVVVVLLRPKEKRRTTTGDDNKTTGKFECLVFFVTYTLFAVVAIISYTMDAIVVQHCIASNHNDSVFGITSILVRSITSNAMVWFSWLFFMFAICRKQFQNSSGQRTVILGGLLVVHTLMWISSFIQEASELNNTFYWLENCTEWHPEQKCKSDRNNFKELKQWLYPCVVEYCLFSVSMTLRMWHSDHKLSCSYSNISELEQEGQPVRQECHASRKLLWAGIVFSAPIFVGYIVVPSLIVNWQCPLNDIEDKDSLSTTVVVYLILSIVTDILFIVCFLVTSCASRGIGKIPMSLELEDYLTLATGFSVQIIAAMTITSDSFNAHLKPSNIKIILSLIKASLDLIRGSFQTVMFVRLKTVRVKDIPNHKRPKFFIAIFISMVISFMFFLWSTTFEGHVSDSVYVNQVAVFGASRWDTILVILNPLTIFYQFQCFWTFLGFIIEMVKCTNRMTSEELSTVYS